MRIFIGGIPDFPSRNESRIRILARTLDLGPCLCGRFWCFRACVLLRDGANSSRFRRVVSRFRVLRSLLGGDGSSLVYGQLPRIEANVQIAGEVLADVVGQERSHIQRYS